MSVKSGTANGKDISADAMTSWYQAFQGVTVDDIADNDPTGDPIFTVTLNFKKWGSETTVPLVCEYFTGTDRTFLLRITGLEDAPVYTVQSKKLDAFIEATKKALG